MQVRSIGQRKKDEVFLNFGRERNPVSLYCRLQIQEGPFYTHANLIGLNKDVTH